MGGVQLYFNPVTIPPGQAAERAFRVFAGPKKPELLEAVGGGLVRSIDLGWFWLAPLLLAGCDDNIWGQAQEETVVAPEATGFAGVQEIVAQR